MQNTYCRLTVTLQHSVGRYEIYTVTEASQLIGVSSGTLRLWETQGLIHPKRLEGGRRLYDEEDIARLRKISWWRKVRGLNAAAIRRVLETEEYQSLGNAESARPPQRDYRFRAQRRKAGLTLKQVSELSGLSVSFISAVERGINGLSPTAAARLEAALQGSQEVDAQSGSVHRLGEGKRIDIAPGITYEWLSNLNGLIEPQLAVVQPGAKSEGIYQHDGEEIIIVLHGALELHLGSETHSLTARDSIHFFSHLPHSWANQGTEEAEVLWITTERGVWAAGSGSHQTKGRNEDA